MQNRRLAKINQHEIFKVVSLENKSIFEILSNRENKSSRN